MSNKNIPNLIIIGDSAYDTNKFFYEDGKTRIKTNLGGSSIYASVPASLFYRVGLVSNAGEDFNEDELKKFNIDLRGFKIYAGEKTSRFYNLLKTKDRQERETKAEYNERLAVEFDSIPAEFLNAKYFYISTMIPSKQKKLITKLKNNNKNAIIGVDTFEGYSNLEETMEVFDMADVAFIDKEFKELLNCKAKTKVIKLGKTGCLLLEDERITSVPAKVIENVKDKTGAGDCLNGVFMNLIANGHSKEEALKGAVKTATASINDFGILKIKERINADRIIEQQEER